MEPRLVNTLYNQSSNQLLKLGYLKDSNAVEHSVDTDISQAVGLKRIENDIECPIYMLESNNYHQSVERTRGNVVWKMIITTSGYEMIESQIVYPYI